MPPRTAALFLTPFQDRILSPTTMGNTGATLSPPPHDPPDKKRRYQLDKGKKTKEKYSLGRARPSPLAFRYLPDTLPVIHFRSRGPGPNDSEPVCIDVKVSEEEKSGLL